MRHVSEHREYDESCQEARQTVDAAGDNGIPVGQKALLYYFIA
jgi:hypothetical protein